MGCRLILAVVVLTFSSMVAEARILPNTLPLPSKVGLPSLPVSESGLPVPVPAVSGLPSIPKVDLPPIPTVPMPDLPLPSLPLPPTPLPNLPIPKLTVNNVQIP
ncbi:hypothetical protein VNO78_03612 [Psophocarpus tetragonolobus]|uniref:Uncharacterized protein n=1 Tax=Psophocarpus tetragonolobus TaxID=3891 RepID=A0AAN9T1T3_PSOTE